MLLDIVSHIIKILDNKNNNIKYFSMATKLHKIHMNKHQTEYQIKIKIMQI